MLKIHTFFDLLCRCITKPEMDTPMVTTTIRIVASALISGAMPRRTFEKINIGNVVAPGPDTKLAI
ncbi:MAG TPA: hypothetical protein QGG06_03835, partial [Gammaproteobacteria bacterium]|nr:hypothetical protein [Gammaproteobacteria bacterium]